MCATTFSSCWCILTKVQYSCTNICEGRIDSLCNIACGVGAGNRAKKGQTVQRWLSANVSENREQN